MSKKQHPEKPENTPQPEQDLPEVAETVTEAKPIEEAEKQPDYYEQFVRLSADFQNYRKRTEREKVSFLAYGKKQFAEKLLPAYEVMLRQQKKMETQEPSEDCQAELKSLRDGMKMLLSELAKAFTAEGIEKIDVVDKPYDPQNAEAVATIPSSSEQEGFVLEEVQMGFSMDGQVLRPARVVVGKGAEEA